MSRKPVTHQITIPPAAAGLRLDRALVDLLNAAGLDISRARLQVLLADGHVKGPPGGKLTATDMGAARKVKADEIYTVSIPAIVAATPRAQKIALDVVFEDKHLIVINKPAGMVVHPAAGNHDGTLVNALLAHCKKSLSGIGGVARPGIVHRLDKDTSGLMVVAKNDAAHHKLAAQFADRSLSRTYQALVWGVPESSKGSIKGNIGRAKNNRQKMAVLKHGGKVALTHYRVLEKFGTATAPLASLVECKLATGRTHQIRVHLAHLGHPVVGDQTYGKRQKVAAQTGAKKLQDFPRQALHAAVLRFIHPQTKKSRQFTAPLPEDFAALLVFLRKKPVKSKP
jgi:23S rRNA pseudouridine1911/1915/1917 synthase